MAKKPLLHGLEVAIPAKTGKGKSFQKRLAPGAGRKPTHRLNLPIPHPKHCRINKLP